MFPKVFRINKFWQYYTLVVSLFAGCVFIGLIYFLIQFAISGEKLLFILLIPLALLLVIILILVLYTNWVFWSYRIEFWENEIRVGRDLNWFAPPIRCAYADIDYVRRPAMKGAIQIIPKHGKPFQLRTNVAGGGDALLDELEKHFDPEKFQPFLRAELKKYSKVDKVNFVLNIPAFAILLLMWLPRLVLPAVAWETIWSSGVLTSGTIEGFWVDDGTIWLTHHEGFNKGAQAIQIRDSQEQRWEISRSLVAYPDLVLADSAGNPWVVDDALYHWTGSSWQSVPTKGYSIRSIAAPAVIQGSYFAFAFQKDKEVPALVKLDLDSGELSAVDLPEEATQAGFSLRGLEKGPGDALYVMLAKPYNPVYFYSFSDGQWGKRMELGDAEWIEPTRFFDQKSEPILGVGDFTLDSSGQLWVISEKDDRSRIGRYHSSSGIWEWTSILEDRCRLCSASYDDIAVDPQGRVWLSARYGHKQGPQDEFGISDGRGADVFLPRWGGTAERLRRYTELNSAYRSGSGSSDLRVSEDGYIWVADERLIRIDANQPELPKPVPDWLARLFDPEFLIKPMLIILAIWLIWTLAVTLFGRLKGRSAPPGQSS